MSDKQLVDLADRTDTLLKLRKAPSQYVILYQLLATGRTMSPKELSVELHLTPKATERAVSKLLEKNLIQRSPFKDGGYTCDQKQVVLALILATSILYEDFEKRKPPTTKPQPVALVEVEAPHLPST
ncbi:MAG: MarR family transcriptional regulator [Candidatus Bathyarchaeota archaeon]|nr:MarR family transcriptional regulator [Candidatus Bathyarchaeota archaeon]